MATITSTGLGSGLNISSMVTQLVAAERAPTQAKLDKEEASLTAKISSFGNFKSAVSAFKNSLASLNKEDTFKTIGATSSDEERIKASVTPNADIGSYQMEVTQLALAHSLASASFASANATLGTGTLNIKFGSDPASASFVQNGEKSLVAIEINSSNNTLTGVRDAINKANAGVNAAVVNDGSGYRLVLSSKDSGAKNGLQISGLASLAYNADTANNKMTQIQPGQDAKFKLNGLEISSPSNKVTETLKGLTLDLQKAEIGKSVTVTVSQDNSSISKAVDGFVKNYNELASAVKTMTGYNAETKKGSVLQGDATVRGGMSQVRGALSHFVPGLTGSIKTLSDIGLKTNADGTLTLDKAKFDKAVASNRDDIAAVFTTIGRSSDKGVRFQEASSSTEAGQFPVSITQAATKGTYSGTQALTFPLVIDSNNKSFALNVDGTQSGTLSLTEGSYATSEAFLAEVQSRVNGDSALKAAGVSVAVSLDASKQLTITSKAFGSASKVAVTQADSALGLAVGNGVVGKDVAGSIGGAVAEGKGQTLTATDGAATGLKLNIEDDQIGDRGNITFSHGLMDGLTKVLNGLLDSKGAIAARTEGMQKSMDKIAKDRVRLDDRMAQYEKRISAQFNKMDAIVGQLSNTSSALAAALNSLPGYK